MIEVKQAIRIASDYLRSLYDAEDVKDIRLEEVELNEWKSASGDGFRGAQWMVTLSFLRFPDREYKRFEIEAGSGAVRAMRMLKI
jgi:hypothetical protein